MTNLELLHDLNRRHERLEVALSALKTDLTELQSRFERPEFVAPTPPPLPVFVPPVIEQMTMPALSADSAAAPVISPLPELPKTVVTPKPAAQPEPETAPADRAGFELQFGRWLARIGAVFALFTLIFFGAMVHQYLGPWSKLGGLTLASGALIAAGLWMEKRDQKMVVYGRTLAGGGLACLYYTLYGAIYVPQLQVISNPLLGGFFLLAWSAGVLMMAERRKSELLSIFAISLAYFSSAITPGNGFSMTADLILAATAVIFQLRNAWTGLSYLCLIGTYAGFVRQAVDVRGPFDFDWVGTLDFWPSAVYLTGAWLIFTTAILLSRAPNFAAGKRMGFLCLNNGAWAGLLLVAAQLGAFGHMGQILETTGFVLLAACAVAQVMQSDALDLSGAYLAQGLGLLTGGVAIVYSGVTRGLLITIESVFLVASGAFSRKLILRIGGGLTAVLGAWYLASELLTGAPSSFAPTLLGTAGVLTFGGALAMLVNAWLARRELWGATPEVARARWVHESVLHVLLALGLLGLGVSLHSSLAWGAPRLAVTGLVLAASIYVLPLYELAPLSQLLLIAAQAISFGLGWEVSTDNWFGQPQWSHDLVALLTMLLSTWWPRQKKVRTQGWLPPLTVVYALAMVAYCYVTFHPHATEQQWMIAAALLSLVFLAYGAWTRLWAFTVSGQILLGLSVFTFLYPDNAYGFPWTWWAAAIPIAVVFATGWIVREFLPRHLKVTDSSRDLMRIVARIYQSIALGLLVRWVFGVAPYPVITFLLVALGTTFIGGCLFLRSSYGVRSGLVLSAVGAVHYLTNTGPWNNAFTWLDAGAFALLLTQPALFRRWGRNLISEGETWVVILVSSAAGWLFVSNAVNAADAHNLTLGWALFAVALTVIGFVANERRQRWCGLGILAAAFVRVGVHDFWVFSDLLKVLTFFALTVICLGLSFLYYKFGDRLKEWL